MYDIVIIGGGAAGLTAGIYSSRRALKTLIISKDLGGQAATTPHVENYPGFDMTDGFELMQKFYNQATKFGAEFVFNEVTQIEKLDDRFIVSTNSEKYEAVAVVLAFGKTPRDLGAIGEDKFKGKGVSYCATCDAPFYKDKVVAVNGGGNSAVDAAILLSKIAKKVYLVHRRKEFRAEAVLIETLNNLSNIELVLDSGVKEIKGDQKVEKIIIIDVSTNEEREIAVDGLFVEIGFEVKASFIKDIVNIDQKNQIIINEFNETSCPGIFAAGDLTTVIHKQIIVSAGEGAKAALSAYAYIQEKQGKKGVSMDWGAK